MAPFVRKRRLCSYDMNEVPPEGYWLNDAEGEVYFCSARCLCIWSLQLATKPNLPEARRKLNADLLMPGGERNHFVDLPELARWAADNALGPTVGTER